MIAIQNIVNLRAFSKHVLVNKVVPAVAIVAVLVALFYIFTVAPNERVMGAVQKVFYFHVGSAITAYGMIFVLFLASVFYLRQRVAEWDLIAQSAASVAFVLCSMVLASGMIWGHSAWNTWWRWEPRLVSFLVLWLILLSYVLLRSFASEHQSQRRFASVLGILAAVNVPVVVLSIKLLEHTEQLHPEVVANDGLQDQRFVVALVLGMAAIGSIALWLFCVKLTNLLIRREVDEVRAEILGVKEIIDG